MFRDLIPGLSIDELRCRFLGVTLGDGEDAAAVASGEGLMGRQSNAGWVPFLWFQSGH